MRQTTLTPSGAPGDCIDYLLMYHPQFVPLIHPVPLVITWICRIFSQSLDYRILEVYPLVSPFVYFGDCCTALIYYQVIETFKNSYSGLHAGCLSALSSFKIFVNLCAHNDSILTVKFGRNNFLEFVHESTSDVNWLGPHIFAGQSKGKRETDAKFQAKL